MFFLQISNNRSKESYFLQASHFGDKDYNLVKYPCGRCNRFFATQKALSSHTRQCKEVVDKSGQVPAVHPLPCIEPGPSAHDPAGEEVHAVEQAQTLEAQPIADNDEDQSEITFVSVSSVSLTTDADFYRPPAGVDPNFACDPWLQKLIPPKTAKKSRQPKQNILSSKLSPRDLQALYVKQPKKAIDKLQFIPSIDCKVESVDLRHGLLLQLESQNPPPLKEQLWLPCLEGIEELSMPFQLEEIQKALSHPNSAPGPDGWKYEELARQTDFPKDFVEGLHQIAATSITPNAWRAYNSMMLFKKT